MTNYQRGAAFEHKTMRALEAMGWKCIRSAGSHSPADVVAMHEGHRPLVVQCKRNGRLDPDEWNELFLFAVDAGAVPILATDKRGGVIWERLTGMKSGGKKQPKEPFEIVDITKEIPF
jgi:Holliday junction resolvase